MELSAGLIMSKVRPDELTLADLALRTACRKVDGVPPGIRWLLSEAHRFVLDKAASAFIADLEGANFHNSSRPRYMRGLETVRLLGRLPHKTTWIEYDVDAFAERQHATYSIQPIDLGASPDPRDRHARIGWLIRQHPKIETAFRLSVVNEFTHPPHLQMLPFDYAWCADEAAIPWLPADAVPDEDPRTMVGMAVGFVVNFKSINEWEVFQPVEYDRVSLLRNSYTLRPARGQLRKIMAVAAGTLRRALMLLAAINDVPIGVKHVTQARGFVAQGRYRKFLSHSVITITLPKGRDPQKVARQVVALARRRAHQVRGHWRRDWRHEGNRIWIHEHQRGDASLGFVTHDYRVEHSNEQKGQIAQP
jgi:hypothetical protein